MKKTLRTLALVLSLVFILSAAVFADEADTSNDAYIIGSWNIYTVYLGENNVVMTHEVPLTIREDHTGAFDLTADYHYTFTWQYSETNNGSHIFRAEFDDNHDEHYSGIITYIYDYEGLNGQLCVMLGNDIAMFCVRTDGQQ